MKPGFYVAEFLPTSSTDEGNLWAVFEWTRQNTRQVNAVRKHMANLPRHARQWWTMNIGPGPERLLALEELPEALEEKYKFGQMPVRITETEAVSLLDESHEDVIYRLEARHLELAGDIVYISAFGKYSGQKYQTMSLEVT